MNGYLFIVCLFPVCAQGRRERRLLHLLVVRTWGWGFLVYSESVMGLFEAGCASGSLFICAFWRGLWTSDSTWVSITLPSGVVSFLFYRFWRRPKGADSTTSSSRVMTYLLNERMGYVSVECLNYLIYRLMLERSCKWEVIWDQALVTQFADDVYRKDHLIRRDTD